MAYTLKTVRRAVAEVLRTCPSIDPEDFDEAVQALLHEWEAEAAEDREWEWLPLDTYCIEDGCNNCNDWGTGEGQFHGRN